MRSCSNRDHAIAKEIVTASAIILLDQASRFEQIDRVAFILSAIKQIGPSIGSETNSKLLNAVFGQSAIFKILSSNGPAIGIKEKLLIQFARPVHDFEQSRFFVWAGAWLEIAFGFEGDAGSFSQFLQRFGEAYPFVLHDPAECVTANIADPAFPNLLFCVDLQARTAISVPRADGNIVASLTAQLKPSADKFDKICCGADALFGI
jgi:hypothetical protein